MMLVVFQRKVIYMGECSRRRGCFGAFSHMLKLAARIRAPWFEDGVA